MKRLSSILLVFLLMVGTNAYNQTICDPAGNVMLYSNYDGGTLNINVDVDIPNLKIGITTYEIVDVNIFGAFVGNITEVIFAGFNAPAAIDGVDPALVTIYFTTTDNIAITNYLGDEIIPGFPPLVNCMVSGSGCSETETGGGNSSPQIVQFYLAEFGPGSILYGHWTDYSVFPAGDFLVSEGGNCCLEDPVTDLNPIYVGGADYNLLPDTTLLCDDEILLDVSFYPVVWGDPEWNTGDVGYTLLVDEPGMYIVSISDYCHYDPGSYLLTDTIYIEPCASTIDTAICDGESFTLPDGSIVTAAGEYEITLTAIDGSDSIVFVNLSLLPVYDILLNDAICDGLVYTLPDGTTTTTTGIYIFNFITAAGCDSIITLNLTVSTSYSTTINTSICDDENYILPDGTLVSTAGTYVNNFTTVAGCDSIITINLIVYPNYTILFDTTVCVGENVILPSGITTNIPGTYTTTFTTISGCDSTINYTLNNFLPTTVTDEIPEVVCLESPPIELIVSLPGGVFSGIGVSGTTFDPTVAGIGGPFYISYTVNDANGCAAGGVYPIIVTQNYADAGADTTIFDTGVAELNATAGGSVTWSPAEGLTCSNCFTTYSDVDYTTTYSLVSIDPNGCIATDEVTVFVITSNENIYIPNTFTPNGDGVNDAFSILGPGIVLIHTFAIYDRWGELIFYTENTSPNQPNALWDGTFKGTDVNQGVYAYTTLVELATGRKVQLKGNVTLIR